MIKEVLPCEFSICTSVTKSVWSENTQILILCSRAPLRMTSNTRVFTQLRTLCINKGCCFSYFFSVFPRCLFIRTFDLICVLFGHVESNSMCVLTLYGLYFTNCLPLYGYTSGSALVAALWNKLSVWEQSIYIYMYTNTWMWVNCHV